MTLKIKKKPEENMFLQIGGNCKLCGVIGVCHKMLAYHRLGKCVEKEKPLIKKKKHQMARDSEIITKGKNDFIFHIGDVKEAVERAEKRLKEVTIKVHDKGIKMWWSTVNQEIEKIWKEEFEEFK